MVNERYENEDQEEGEYHFSDDQANYDMDIEGTARDSAAAAVIAPKESLTEKLKQHRRIVIGIIVFVVLLAIVYKLVAPSSNPVTDFQPNSKTTSAAETQKASAKKEGKHSASSQAAQVTQTTTQTITQPAAIQQPAASSPAQQPAMPASPAANSADTALIQSNKNVLDRVATLEQQNSAMMSLMQTQYAQKIADAELQNTQLRTQVQELNARISNMEVAFRQLTKILRNISPASSAIKAPANHDDMMANAPPAAKITQPKSSYTVQAIIPGRAWLKSDSGDTVTVAEGDMLKDFGRITKIDPYDGIVDIDTGNKIISLSYGVSGD